MKKIQIGVMGSAADLNYSEDIQRIAEEVGKYIAEAGGVTVYGAEKDYDSLSTAAARGAKSVGGLTVGVTYGKGSEIYDKENTDVIIVTGLERGGGREYVLANSCDGIIAVSGGSGTLTEIAIAYQSNIPVVVIENTGGWSDKLAGTFIDDRKRFLIESAKDARSAVKRIMKLTNN